MTRSGRKEGLLVSEQLAFYRRNGTGCGFAAIASRDPRRFGWRHEICEADSEEFDRVLSQVAGSASVSTLSILLPTVRDVRGLERLILEWAKLARNTVEVLVENETIFVGLRHYLDVEKSWVSGFGPFDFLPGTRRAPCTELVLRVKPRPAYENLVSSAKQYTGHTVHLADMHMIGMPDDRFMRVYRSSFKSVKRILGHPADRASAAKTSFAIPVQMVSEEGLMRMRTAGGEGVISPT